MLASEIVMFLAANIIGLFVGVALMSHSYIYVQETHVAVSNFLVSFFIATVIIIALLKFLKGVTFFNGLLAFLIFIGCETVFSVFTFEIVAILIAVELVIIRFLVPNVLVQNVVLIVAIAGLSANLGLFLSIPAVLIIISVLSVYDVIAVYKTKHMVTMFKGLVSKGVPFSLIIPGKVGNMRTNIKDAQPGTGEFMMLGTGDVAFPVIFAVSALRVGWISSVAVVAGALVGLLSIHFLLLRKKKGAIPALPPIMIFSILFFLASLFFTGGI